VLIIKHVNSKTKEIIMIKTILKRLDRIESLINNKIADRWYDIDEAMNSEDPIII